MIQPFIRMTRTMLLLALFPLYWAQASPAQTSTASSFTLLASPMSVGPDEIISLQWTAPKDHVAQDWIGLFQVGSNDSDPSVIAWKYVPVGSNGIMSFKAPKILIPRKYEFRYFFNNGFTRKATSNVVSVAQTVSASTPYTVTASPGTVSSNGNVTVSWKAPAAHLVNDWIGLYVVGAPDAGTTFISWKHVPAGSAGTLTFAMPNASVTQSYEFRYFLNDGYTEAARSNPVKVSGSGTPPISPLPPSPTPSPTPTAPPPPSSPPAAPSPTPTTSSNSGQCPNGKQVAFPGAEGFGRCAQGGRGGRVIEVTNLNDSGPGSLRECAEAESGPRTCVFRVSGTITLTTKDIVVTNPYLTIAGQTAPGDGVALKDAGLAIKADHVIVRHLRVRPGLAQLTRTGQNVNGIMIQSNEGAAVHDIILDHCSVSWGSDDLIYVVYGTDNVTIQWSIISEALECAQCGGKGLLLDAKSVTVHHSLYAHIYIRWPQISKGNLDFVNNVKYNGNGTDAQIGPFYGPILANMVGNYSKDGPNAMSSNLRYAEFRTAGQLPYSASSGLYVEDNIGRYWDGRGGILYGTASPHRAIIWGDNGGIPVQNQRFPYPPVTTTSAQQAYTDVLNRVGALPRDNADARVIADVRNGTGMWLADPLQVGGWPVLNPSTPPVDTDHDGMPDEWESSHGLNLVSASDGPADANHDGFTNFEEYLHSLTASTP